LKLSFLRNFSRKRLIMDEIISIKIMEGSRKQVFFSFVG